MRLRTSVTVPAVLALLILTACATTPEPAPPPQPMASPQAEVRATDVPPALANPASENCVAQRGRLEIESRTDGGEFGVCYFEDNRQCEEWALLRGECPVGGVKVTGYVTPAGRYCAITGGEYVVTGMAGQADEQGACTLKDGRVCDAWGLYSGTCQPVSVAPEGEEPGLQLPIAEVCNGMAQALMQAVTAEVTQSEVDLIDPSTGATGPGCRAGATGTGVDFTSPDAVIKAITAVLVGGGWEEDMMLASGGPTGMGSGFRSRDLVCLATAIWHPGPAASCPADKPISECQVPPDQQMYTVTLDCAQEAAGAPSP